MLERECNAVGRRASCHTGDPCNLTSSLHVAEHQQGKHKAYLSVRRIRNGSCGPAEQSPLGQGAHWRVWLRGGRPSSYCPPWNGRTTIHGGRSCPLSCPAPCQGLQVAQGYPLLLDQRLQLSIITVLSNTAAATSHSSRGADCTRGLRI